jgi:protein-tyrosine kinase
MSKIEKALKKASALENLDPSAPVVKEDQQLVPTQPELRTVTPAISRMAEPWQLSEADRADARIIFPEMKDARVINAFRTIRTKIIERCGSDNGVILVTSTAPDAGSSFMALNIAVAFTLDESKTALLVDCNLRDDEYDPLMSPDMNYGLTDYLESDTINLEQVIHPVGIERLRLIPAGRKSEIPTEQLGSQRMKKMLADVKARYPDRYIILDAAAVTESADARVLMDACDVVVLVVPYGMSTEAQVWSAANAIEESKFLGVVFNNQPQLPKLSIS